MPCRFYNRIDQMVESMLHQLHCIFKISSRIRNSCLKWIKLGKQWKRRIGKDGKDLGGSFKGRVICYPTSLSFETSCPTSAPSSHTQVYSSHHYISALNSFVLFFPIFNTSLFRIIVFCHLFLDFYHIVRISKI